MRTSGWRGGTEREKPRQWGFSFTCQIKSPSQRHVILLAAGETNFLNRIKINHSKAYSKDHSRTYCPSQSNIGMPPRPIRFPK